MPAWPSYILMARQRGSSHLPCSPDCILASQAALQAPGRCVPCPPSCTAGMYHGCNMQGPEMCIPSYPAGTRQMRAMPIISPCRHQADVCHAYHLIKGGGVHTANIVTMMYGDIAYHADNPFPGKIFNRPGG
eukprot:1158381-Pelagomonas_calceolata.AAC.1